MSSKQPYCCIGGPSLSKQYTRYTPYEPQKRPDAIALGSDGENNPFYFVDVVGTVSTGQTGNLEVVKRLTSPGHLRGETNNLELGSTCSSDTTTGRPTWSLSAKDIPASARKIYCILQGRKPGFYFDWPGAEQQVRGFRDGLYISFPRGSKKAALTPANAEAAIRDAVTYMNHTFETCQYGCGGKCRLLAVDMAVKADPGQVIPPEHREEKRDRNMCRFCGKRPKANNERLCATCISGPDVVDAIRICAEEHGLVAEQAHVLGLIARGYNVFFTGAAGTGKTKIVEAARAFFRHKDRTVDVRIVAPTGIAALAAHGTTIHTYAGWTAKLSQSSLTCLRDQAHRTRIWKRFNDTEVLIIEEISMVESDTLTRLSAMMESASREPHGPRPFGGVQVIICGDFYQLPPVLPFRSCLECGLVGEKLHNGVFQCQHGDRQDEEKWAFQSPAWAALQLVNVELKHVHRQADAVFTRILRNVRLGVELTDDEENALLNYNEHLDHDAAIKLMPHRKVVDSINAYHMDQLQAIPRKYRCIDAFDRQPRHTEYLDLDASEQLKDHRYPHELELKTGMKVLLTANLDLPAGLANGSSGTIIGFVPMRSYETALSPLATKRPQEDEEEEEEEDHHHQTFPPAGSHHAHQQIMTSRFRAAQSPHQWYPIVKFLSPNNSQNLTRVIPAHCSITELGEDSPYSLLSRTQIPLIAGWAITIHKSQGMTLDQVVVNLDQCFAPGHAYVALSRARSLRTMAVQTLPAPRQMRADETVKGFMERTFGGDGERRGKEEQEEGGVEAEDYYCYYSCEEVKKEEGKEEEDCKIKVEECEEV